MAPLDGFRGKESIRHVGISWAYPSLGAEDEGEEESTIFKGSLSEDAG